MYKITFHTMVILGILAVVSCNKSKEDIDALVNEVAIDIEVVKNPEILYSDSSVVKVKIIAPTLLRHVSRSKPKEEFPDGILVNFLSKKAKKPYSWIKANYAIREPSLKKITFKDKVVFENNTGETLMTSELIWDEAQEILNTDKFIKIIQPQTKDTTTGFGFVTNQEFTRFEIKKKGSASLNVDELTRQLEIN